MGEQWIWEGFGAGGGGVERDYGTILTNDALYFKRHTWLQVAHPRQDSEAAFYADIYKQVVNILLLQDEKAKARSSLQVMHLCGQLNLEHGNHCSPGLLDLQGRIIKTGYSGRNGNISPGLGRKLLLGWSKYIFPLLQKQRNTNKKWPSVLTHMSSHLPPGCK